MMAVMMLPSAAPMIRVFRLVAGGCTQPLAPHGPVPDRVPAHVGRGRHPGVGPWHHAHGAGAPAAQAIGVTLVVAGLYQLTPLKDVCLRACRTPMDFLTHSYSGSLGAVRVGVEHGLYCVDYCSGLMAAFVLFGAMSLPWLAAVATLAFAEKVLPRAAHVGRVAGVAPIAAGLVMARPDMAMPAEMTM